MERKARIQRQFGELVLRAAHEAGITPEAPFRVVDATILHVVTNNNQPTTFADLQAQLEPVITTAEKFDGLPDYCLPTTQIVFGATPLSQDPNHALHGVLAALEMKDALNALKTVSTRILLQTGKVGSGPFGKPGEQMRYTHMGLPVSLCKDMAPLTEGWNECEIFIGEETMRRTQGIVKVEESFAFFSEGGKTPRMVYRVLGAK